MMIASFRTWQEVPEEDEAQPEATPEPEPPREDITELNGPIREMLERDHFGGILLFKENIAGPEQTLRLVSEMRTVNQSGGGLPQIFFADQEGGNVNRIGFGTQGVSNMALGATGDPENARIMASRVDFCIRLRRRVISRGEPALRSSHSVVTCCFREFREKATASLILS